MTERDDYASKKSSKTQRKVSARELESAHNPALKRLGKTVEQREEDETIVSYSRMHHRHNRK